MREIDIWLEAACLGGWRFMCGEGIRRERSDATMTECPITAIANNRMGGPYFAITRVDAAASYLGIESELADKIIEMADEPSSDWCDGDDDDEYYDENFDADEFTLEE